MNESVYQNMPVWILTRDRGEIGQLGSCFVVVVPQPSSTATLETIPYAKRVRRQRVNYDCLFHLVPLQPLFDADGRYCATPYCPATPPIYSASFPPDSTACVVPSPEKLRLRISRQ